MNVKKGYEEIAELLMANENKKIKTIMPQLLELMQKKNNASGLANTFIKDAEGNVIAVFCYYHKKFELISEVQYGSKKGTATGLNTMCKEGVSRWTKQQRIKKQSEAGLLTKIVNGELTAEDIPTAQAEIAETAKLIEPREDGHGYDEADEALEVQSQGLTPINEEL